MFETGIRQLRMVLAMVRGRPIDSRNVARLIEDAIETMATFGAPGEDVEQLLDGPFADPTLRQEFQTRSLRRTARRLGQSSPYYRRLFAEHGVDPRHLRLDEMPAIPTTTKRDLIARQREFLVEGAKPFVMTRTTGTTGNPAEVWLSRYEVELWPALGALSGLLRGEITPQDCMQINISSRATAAVQQNLAVCRLVGARARMIGVVPPDESVDSLLGGGERAPTLLNTYPSYLAELVRAARRRGLGPGDFRLRRIDCGGEVLSSALSKAAVATFGPVRVNDTFGMTEVLPVSGRVCGHQHLHHDVNMGYVEVIDLDTGLPAAPGRLGTVVVTPYYPYRECMPVFRYDTRDVVRCPPEGPLECDLAGIPATSRILGKADHLLHTDDGTVTRRELVEVIEGLPSEPWPARFAATVEGGHLRLRVGGAHAPSGDGELRERLLEAGFHVDLTTEPTPAILPLRADLLETTFSGVRS